MTTTETARKLNRIVTLHGFVNARRDHGKIIFVDLRDREGLIQLVFNPENKSAYQLGEKLRPEWVVKVRGVVKPRPEKMVNPKLATGKVEIVVRELKILSEAKTPPFEISEDTRKVEDELRLKYRYLDLRSERMKKNLILRHKVVKFIRDFMDEKGFIEIETPILTKSTPEGARDFIVPSRQSPGKFYALPQSPQQYKQLLMVSGLGKYFQIARCFRDEDSRADRQAEFTQLDIEMSYVNQGDILDLTEELFTKLVKKITPEKKITKLPFPRLSFKEVMKKYGTDSPDLRKNKKDSNELAFTFIIDWPMFEWNKEEKRWDPHHHIFTSPKEEDIPLLDKDPAKVRSWQHDLVLNGHEVGGGSIRIASPKIQEKVLELVGIPKKQIKNKFGHMLEAFEFGVPPHGGIAPGIDRLVMLLAGEDNIREVMAFPKTGDGRDLMMDSPSQVEEKQLKELHLKLDK